MALVVFVVGLNVTVSDVRNAMFVRRTIISAPVLGFALWILCGSVWFHWNRFPTKQQWILGRKAYLRYYFLLNKQILYLFLFWLLGFGWFWHWVDLDVGCAKEQGVCAKCRCRVDRIVGRFLSEKLFLWVMYDIFYFYCFWVVLVFCCRDSSEVEAEQKLLEEVSFFSLCYNLYALDFCIMEANLIDGFVWFCSRQLRMLEKGTEGLCYVQ